MAKGFAKQSLTVSSLSSSYALFGCLACDCLSVSVPGTQEQGLAEGL